MRGRQHDLSRFLFAFQVSGVNGDLLLPALRWLKLSQVPWWDTVLGYIAGCLRVRAVRGAKKLSLLKIGVASRKGVPDNDVLRGLLDVLKPFVERPIITYYSD